MPLASSLLTEIHPQERQYCLHKIVGFYAKNSVHLLIKYKSEIRKLRNRKTKENPGGYILVNEMDGKEFVQKKRVKSTQISIQDTREKGGLISDCRGTWNAMFSLYCVLYRLRNHHLIFKWNLRNILIQCSSSLGWNIFKHIPLFYVLLHKRNKKPL